MKYSNQIFASWSWCLECTSIICCGCYIRQLIPREIWANIGKTRALKSSFSAHHHSRLKSQLDDTHFLQDWLHLGPGQKCSVIRMLTCDPSYHSVISINWTVKISLLNLISMWYTPNLLRSSRKQAADLCTMFCNKLFSVDDIAVNVVHLTFNGMAKPHLYHLPTNKTVTRKLYFTRLPVRSPWTDFHQTGNKHSSRWRKSILTNCVAICSRVL